MSWSRGVKGASHHGTLDGYSVKFGTYPLDEGPRINILGKSIFFKLSTYALYINYIICYTFFTKLFSSHPSNSTEYHSTRFSRLKNKRETQITRPSNSKRVKLSAVTFLSRFRRNKKIKARDFVAINAAKASRFGTHPNAAIRWC